jgi:hypothetical protein
MESKTDCICINGHYKSGCPFTFEQGGSKYHCIGGDLKALPADDGSESTDSWENEELETGINGLMDALEKHNVDTSQRRKLDVQGLRSVVGNSPPTAFKGNMMYDLPKQLNRMEDAAQVLMKDNRTSLRKFEALRINGNSINNYSIGGFNIDIKKTEDAVKKISPLPPSALPKIFMDDDLNFYHHFFKGMESLLGKSKLQEIVTSRVHHEEKYNQLPGLICGFMESGLSVGDNALTMLVKKVLSSTFAKATVNESGKEVTVLQVSANLWGFRYIETNMYLKDADISMWLSNCYNHYRTLWFDTFKSSGVPEFAIEGVILDHSRPVLNIRHKTGRGSGPMYPTGRSNDAIQTQSMSQDIVPYERRPRTRRSESRRSNTWFN